MKTHEPGTVPRIRETAVARIGPDARPVALHIEEPEVEVAAHAPTERHELVHPALVIRRVVFQTAHVVLQLPVLLFEVLEALIDVFRVRWGAPSMGGRAAMSVAEVASASVMWVAGVASASAMSVARVAAGFLRGAALEARRPPVGPRERAPAKY